METLINNTPQINLWEEKNSIEPKKNFVNKTESELVDFIKNIKIESEKNECEDIGNKKKWKKNCPNCGNEVFYTNEEGLKRSIKNNRNCLKCGSFKKDRYIGMKFGSLTIINQYNEISPCNSRIVKVDYKCDCGYVGINKRFGCVKRQKMCSQCKKKNTFKIKDPGKSAFNNLYRSYQKGAEKRHYEFKLTKNDFELLTKKNCYYCGGVPNNIQKALKGKEIYVYNGIERVDNTRGYLSKNCVSCCKKCNSFKLNTSVEDFLNHIKKIYEYKKL